MLTYNKQQLPDLKTIELASKMDDEKQRRRSACYAELQTAEPWMLNLIFAALPVFAIDDTLPPKLRLRGLK